jgi:Histidine kinase
MALNAALAPAAASRRRLVLGYLGLVLLCVLLFAIAGTDWQRGTRSFTEGLLLALWHLGPPALLGALVWPWTQRLQSAATPRALAGHAAGALLFVLAWLLIDWGSAALFFGAEHARASLEQGLALRTAGGVFAYGALVTGFGGVLHARRAQAAALQAAQSERDAAQAQAALVRAELALIQGKLNPHFLFNTLNSLLLLTRRDPARAETALHTFSRLMRYVLDRSREPEARVLLRDELAFVRDYLSLEQLRLGERLRVAWDIALDAEDAALPPLTLQPLVENAVLHGIAPQVAGGLLSLSARRDGDLLQLCVADDGAGSAWPPKRQGVGLDALQRRLALDPSGQAQLRVETKPGAGFAVTVQLPYET